MGAVSNSLRIPDEIRRQLGPGEQVLWHGRPRRGVLLRATDVVALPLALAWLAWLGWVATQLDGGYAVASMPSLLLLLGGCALWARYLVDARTRAATWYGVTGERIIIVSGVFTRSIKSLNLAGLHELRLVERRSGEGTIVFGPEPPTLWRQRSLAVSLRRPRAPRFDTIPDARNVVMLIRSIQRGTHVRG